ncbi:hypothetical protein [Streptomyces longwoodensis]|uniref:hypothetical protein n=1 Tax=Streptomyces longwoodensis TaxID=68231 RepID=UPI00384E886E
MSEALQYEELLVIDCAGDAQGLVFELEEQGGGEALQAAKRCSAGVVVIAAVVGGVGGDGRARLALGCGFDRGEQGAGGGGIEAAGGVLVCFLGGAAQLCQEGLLAQEAVFDRGLDQQGQALVGVVSQGADGAGGAVGGEDGVQGLPGVHPGVVFEGGGGGAQLEDEVVPGDFC